MEYLKSQTHFAALLIEEGAGERDSGNNLDSADSTANYVFNKGNVNEIVKYLRNKIRSLHDSQKDHQKCIDKMQGRIDAYERVILRLCPPPPPPTPEEELAALKQSLCVLAGITEYTDAELREEIAKLAEVPF